VIQNSGFEQVVNNTKLRSGIDVRLPLSPGIASLEPALEVIRQVNECFAEDPEWSARLLKPPLLRGVDEITPQALVVSVLLTTQAGEQWDAKRALMQRLVVGLEKAGIPLANIEHPVLTGA
jgi:small conductance mechanosensitive channel